MEMSKQTWTIGELIHWSTNYLRSHKSDSPRLDAELLLANCLKCNRIDLYLQFDKPITADEKAGYREAIKRRAQGEPVAYITGYKEFYGLSFHVTPDVLIPRPDTELIVEQAHQYFSKKDDVSSLKVLDLGTGSGCIAISIAHLYPGLQVEAWDISSPALKVAEKNAAALGVNVKLHQVDMLDESAWKNLDNTYDVVCSNPPYICETERDHLAASVKDYEPGLALFAGEKGLAFYRFLAKQIRSSLKDGGILLAEMGATQSFAVLEMFQSSGWQSTEVIQDLAGINRLLLASKHAS
jgi:release factor glutamine methyltransferase